MLALGHPRGLKPGAGRLPDEDGLNEVGGVVRVRAQEVGPATLLCADHVGRDVLPQAVAAEICHLRCGRELVVVHGAELAVVADPAPSHVERPVAEHLPPLEAGLERHQALVEPPELRTEDALALRAGPRRLCRGPLIHVQVAALLEEPGQHREAHVDGDTAVASHALRKLRLCRFRASADSRRLTPPAPLSLTPPNGRRRREEGGERQYCDRSGRGNGEMCSLCVHA